MVRKLCKALFKKKLLFWGKLSAAILGLGILFWWLREIIQSIPPEQIRDFFRSLGAIGPAVYILIVVFCTVISPLGSIFLWPIVLMIWGFPWAAIYTLSGAISGAVANFWIAKIYGRPLIRKLISDKGMELVDKISLEAGLPALFILRLIPGGMFDYVSYAAGLVSLPFWSYFFITAFFSCLYNLIIFYFMERVISYFGFPFYLIFGYILATISVSFLVLRQIFKNQKNKSSSFF